jgi:hypothetical protein
MVGVVPSDEQQECREGYPVAASKIVESRHGSDFAILFFGNSFVLFRCVSEE